MELLKWAMLQLSDCNLALVHVVLIKHLIEKKKKKRIFTEEDIYL